MSSLGRVVLQFSLILLSLALAFGVGCRQGFLKGAAVIQDRWDQDRKHIEEAYANLVKELAESTARHQTVQEELVHALDQAKDTAARELLEQRGTYEQRLLQSARRAETYRRQAETAEASAASCRGLASHAARLDRTLEEGRHLVEELRSTLGLRERQLILLGQQILNDRALIGRIEDGRE